MSAWVYILRSDRGNYYVGSTSNLTQRIKDHRKGYTHSTKHMRDFKLVFSQEVASLGVARKAEKRIKSWKRKDYIDRIIADGMIEFLEKSP